MGCFPKNKKNSTVDREPEVQKIFWCRTLKTLNSMPASKLVCNIPKVEREQRLEDFQSGKIRNLAIMNPMVHGWRLDMEVLPEHHFMDEGWSLREMDQARGRTVAKVSDEEPQTPEDWFAEMARTRLSLNMKTDQEYTGGDPLYEEVHTIQLLLDGEVISEVKS